MVKPNLPAINSIFPVMVRTVGDAPGWTFGRRVFYPEYAWAKEPLSDGAIRILREDKVVPGESSGRVVVAALAPMGDGRWKLISFSHLDPVLKQVNNAVVDGPTMEEAQANLVRLVSTLVRMEPHTTFTTNSFDTP